ncbi:Lrp/AsnC family transcriptional regulator [Candidatus Woesearchaeota archaeon]|nr:Lrp/AsnC family transcriptional regulator [Candidatus Woesearchaeota archaeon]
MPDKIKNSDYKLLEALRIDSRATISQISKQIGIPANLAFRIIKRLESGCLSRYCASLDFSALGFGIHIFFIVKSKPLPGLITQSPNINGIYRISANYSYLIDAFFRSLNEADKFENNLRHLGVQKFYVSSILKLEDAII